ncbi:MAG: winged helix-turn-helix domain-containing protein [Methanosarcinaceae archaeon]
MSGSIVVDSSELRELKEEVSKLNGQLNHFIQRSNQEHTDSLLEGLRDRYSEVFFQKEVADAKTSLSREMVKDCPMNSRCSLAFIEFLVNSAECIKTGSVADSVVNSFRDNLEKIKENLPYEHCSQCTSEVTRLFEKQIDLMRSLGIYVGDGVYTLPISEVSAGVMVESVLEPITNKHRFMIMQAVATQAQSFSELSKTTGLRGGNLLFHLRKLQDSDMILQRNERGDYVITDKGYQILKMVVECYSRLIL